MPIVDDVLRIRDWLEEYVCPQITLKRPNDDIQDSDYPYELVHPQAFAMTPPNILDVPIGDYPAPSITVRIDSREREDVGDFVYQSQRRVPIILLFSAWDPGIHGKDLYLPAGTTVDGDVLYKRNEEDSFQVSAEGWMDSWNFVDTTLRIIENTQRLNGLTVDLNHIGWGGSDTEDLRAYYPYWFAAIYMTVFEPMVRQDPLS